MTLKICLVGEFEKPPTEAMRKTAQEYAMRLDEHYDVLRINARNGYRPGNLQAIRSFEPDIVHFIPGPSIFSFTYTKLVGAITGAAVIHSAPLSAFYDIDGSLYYKLSYHSRHLIPAVKPDMVLVQSEQSYRFFTQQGINCERLFSGVDLDTFTPVDKDQKRTYRERYDLPVDDHISLHVGSLKRWRNVHRLPEIVGDDSQLVVVGSTATPEERSVKRELENAGAILIHEYIEDIQEVYAAADLYVFPTENAVACCDVPLSVLEAMATNLPVLTTEFGGLPAMFDDGGGIAFGSTPKELALAFDTVLADDEVTTRSSVERYSWDQSVEKLQAIYERVTHQ